MIRSMINGLSLFHSINQAALIGDIDRIKNEVVKGISGCLGIVLSLTIEIVDIVYTAAKVDRVQ